jgi:flagellar hook-associated protein 1
LDTLTSMVNQHTATIASLNKQIAQATTAGNTPNNLLDARNEAVRTLNELVGVTVQEHDNVYDITLGTGQALVQGSTSNTLSAVPGKVDKSQYTHPDQLPAIELRRHLGDQRRQDRRPVALSR